MVLSVILPVPWIEEVDIWGGYCNFYSYHAVIEKQLTWLGLRCFCFTSWEKECWRERKKISSISDHPKSKLDRCKILNQRNQYLRFISFELLKLSFVTVMRRKYWILRETEEINRIVSISSTQMWFEIYILFLKMTARGLTDASLKAQKSSYMHPK